VIQTQEFPFRQWSVTVERKAFRRKLTISLKPGKPIVVKASLRTPMKLIEAFLLEKERWIEKHMTQFEQQLAEFPDKKLVQAETFPFLGEPLTLRFVLTPLKQVFFSRHEHHLQMHLPEALWNEISEDEIQEYFPKLQKFYQLEAEKLVRERIQIWSEQMQLFPKSVNLRNQKSRWGSCSSRGSIQINWRLIGAPLFVIDYILIHELAHLQHMNHSNKFWDLVARHYPEYEEAEKWLKEKHQLLAFLRPEA
jgi:predicted metal-dependent hydrolase